MLTIACVLKQDVGSEYHPMHVERLFLQVQAFAPPHRFVCLSNVYVGPIVERIPLEEDWPGWWSKLELFRPGLFEDRVLYLDLDVIVCGDLTPLAEHPAPFVAIKDYMHPKQLNSSVMAFDPEAGRAAFSGAAHTMYHGDQGWITEAIPDAARFPKNWCPSYRLQTKKFGQPDEAKVIVFHGQPKPWGLESYNKSKRSLGHAPR